MNEMLDDSIVEFLLSSSSSSSSSSTSSSSSSSSSFSTSTDSLMNSMFPGDEVCHVVNQFSTSQFKQRVSNFVKDVVNKYSDEEFRQHFRLSRTVAYKLIQMYEESSHFKTKLCGGRKGVTAESQCLAFLWFAANKSTYREVSNLFDVAPSAAYTHLTNILNFLFDISPKIIKFPSTEEEKAQKSEEFQQIAGFPNVLGCIDGCYIYIRKPAHKVRSTYVNRHGLISITLQGICDANKKFLDVFIGSPSKIHDSRIFKLSFISKKLPEICGENYHLLGDAAYPLKEFLMTPYKDYGDLNESKRNFNTRHCQTRVKIENTFGLLKQRFRQLIRLDFFTVKRMCKFVLACCVLHNLCIDNDDSWDEGDTTEHEEVRITAVSTDENMETLSEAVEKHLGELKRVHIMDAF